MPETLLVGRTAVVTGARRRVGAAITETVRRQGAHVVRRRRDRAGVQERIAALHAQPRRCGGIRRDLAANPARANLLEQVGQVGILVNNAGGFLRVDTTTDTAPDEWDAQLQAKPAVPRRAARNGAPPLGPDRQQRVGHGHGPTVLDIRPDGTAAAVPGSTIGENSP